MKVKIAESLAEIPFNNEGLAEVTINGKLYCISWHNNCFGACAATCPHAGAKLAHGYIDALGNIVCPVHRYKFSLANGRNTSGEGYYLKTYKTVVEEDGVYLLLP